MQPLSRREVMDYTLQIARVATPIHHRIKRGDDLMDIVNDTFLLEQPGIASEHYRALFAVALLMIATEA